MRDLPVQPESSEKEATARWWWSLFNAAEDAQMICRADGVALHINPKAIRLFKLRSESGIADFSIYKILPSSSHQKLDAVLKNCQAPSESIPGVVVALDDVSTSMMNLDVVPLDGGLVLVTFKDNSMRHRLESHVQRLITAIDATPDVFLVTDTNLRITYVNPAFQTATGYGIEEVIGRADAFLRAPSDQEKVRDYLGNVSLGREWIGELTNIRRNGESYQVESTVSPIFSMAGVFMGYVICERDITQRNQLQAAVRTERDFVQSILQSLEGAIYSLDCDFRLTHANDGWRRLAMEHGGIRLNGAPKMGSALLDYVPDPERRAELQSVFQTVLTSGQAQVNFFHAADGHYWAVKVSPWVAGPQKRGLICSVEDQTQNHELQNQLFQSQKMEIIGTLAAGVAHDFNNLLQVIIGHAQLIQLELENQSSVPHQGLEKISMAAFRARDITRQLLSFSRATDERSVVLDLNEVITDAGKLIRCTLQQNVGLEIRTIKEPIPVKIDSTRASQALLNLCVNAQDAMPHGGQLTLSNAIVKLSGPVAVRHQLQPGEPFACCSVSDTGGGIPLHLLSRIFQPFFTTKTAGKGTGLGLPIVQRIVQEAGGFVEVDSVPGTGTTFHLYFPFVREQVSAVTEPPPMILAQGQGYVLVVDDVDLLREFAKNFLEMAGFNVLTAATGNEAMQILTAHGQPVDLILADYSMPGMNGVELLNQVTARWPKTKFILATGFFNESIQENVNRHQASLILKPYAIDDVIKLIVQKIAEG